MADSFESQVAQISHEAKILNDWFNENGYYSFAFDQKGFSEFDELPDEIEQSRKNLERAAKAVHDLTAKPEDHVTRLARNFHDTSTLHWLVRFKVPEAIPLRGSISYEQVAKACDVNVSHLKRILRYAFTNHLFQEPVPGEVGHTASSAVLVTDPDVRQQVELSCEEMFPPSAKLVEAHEKWMAKEEKTRTPFQLAWDTTQSQDEYLAQPELSERAAAFSEAVNSVKAQPEYSLTHTINGFNWSKSRRIVEIGGDGSTAIALAQSFPNLRIMVEYSPDLLSLGQQTLEVPAELGHKLFFVDHDFLSNKPQPEEVSGAEVYLLRQALSRYTDKYAAQILENLDEFLHEGAKLVIVEAVLPTPGSIPLDEERELRSRDLEAMQMYNGKERQLDDWEELLRSVDPELRITGVKKPEGSALSIIQVELQS